MWLHRQGIRQAPFVGVTDPGTGHNPMTKLTHEAVAHCAHQLWQDSGCVEGRDLDNWIEAEQLLVSDESSAMLATAMQQTHAPVHISGESPAEHAREEVAIQQKHESRAASMSRKTAPTAKPPESGKPLWSQPHSR